MAPHVAFAAIRDGQTIGRSVLLFSTSAGATPDYICTTALSLLITQFQIGKRSVDGTISGGVLVRAEATFYGVPKNLKYRAILGTMCAGGLRVSEVTNLRVPDRGETVAYACNESQLIGPGVEVMQRRP